MKKLSHLLFIIGFLVFTTSNAQSVDPVYIQKQWKALWIKVPDSGNSEYGVYVFRKGFELTSVNNVSLMLTSL